MPEQDNIQKENRVKNVEPESKIKDGGRFKKAFAWLRRKFWSLRMFFFNWLVGAGLIASTSVCPFCGQPGCPVGIGQASILGLLLARILMMFSSKKKHKHDHVHEHQHKSGHSEEMNLQECCTDGMPGHHGRSPE